METDAYFLAAILGCMLAFVAIMGWRRLIPCILFFGLCPFSLHAQYYDMDNDVPAINEVRDAVISAESSIITQMYYLQSAMSYLDQDTDGDNLEAIRQAVSSVESALWSLPWYVDQDNDVPMLTELKGVLDMMYSTQDQDNDVPVLTEIKEILMSTEDEITLIGGDVEALKDSVVGALVDTTVESDATSDDLDKFTKPPVKTLQDLEDNTPQLNLLDGDGGLIDESTQSGLDVFKDSFHIDNIIDNDIDAVPLPTVEHMTITSVGGIADIVLDFASPMIEHFNTALPYINTILTSICAFFIVYKGGELMVNIVAA